MLDAEKTEVVNELTALQTAKAESEKKRKQADAVALELRARLAEYEASDSDVRQQLAKVIICCKFPLCIVWIYKVATNIVFIK